MTHKIIFACFAFVLFCFSVISETNEIFSLKVEGGFYSIVNRSDKTLQCFLDGSEAFYTFSIRPYKQSRWYYIGSIKKYNCLIPWSIADPPIIKL